MGFLETKTNSNWVACVETFPLHMPGVKTYRRLLLLICDDICMYNSSSYAVWFRFAYIPSLFSGVDVLLDIQYHGHRSYLKFYFKFQHYDDVIMGTIASQITSLTSVYSTVYSDADQSKHQSSASLAFVWGIHRGPVNSPHKWPVTRKPFPFDDVIMSKELFLSFHTTNVLKCVS